MRCTACVVKAALSVARAAHYNPRAGCTVAASIQAAAAVGRHARGSPFMATTAAATAPVSMNADPQQRAETHESVFMPARIGGMRFESDAVSS